LQKKIPNIKMHQLGRHIWNLTKSHYSFQIWKENEQQKQ
jgi:hypothetical protein